MSQTSVLSLASSIPIKYIFPEMPPLNNSKATVSFGLFGINYLWIIQLAGIP